MSKFTLPEVRQNIRAPFQLNPTLTQLSEELAYINTVFEQNLSRYWTSLQSSFPLILLPFQSNFRIKLNATAETACWRCWCAGKHYIHLETCMHIIPNRSCATATNTACRRPINSSYTGSSQKNKTHDVNDVTMINMFKWGGVWLPWRKTYITWLLSFSHYWWLGC